ncbi:NUDIX domain-containing protein [Vibrio sp. PNB22_3_1]
MNCYKGNKNNGEIEIIDTREVFSNEFVSISNDQVSFPSGTVGEYLRIEQKCPYGVSVLAINNGKCLLINEFVHNEREWTWKVPGGRGEPHLSALQCAQKELLEEAGYLASRWSKLITLRSNGIPHHIFVAELLNFHSHQREDTECIRGMQWHTQSDALRRIQFDTVDPITALCLTLFINQAS